MAEYDIIIVTVAMALITISVYLLYMLSKSRTEKKGDQDYNIVKAIINEFDNREENQNKTIVELMVKIDLLDKKISERSNKEVVFQSNQKGMAIKVLPSSIGVTTKSLTESIGPIEIQILRYISGGPRTSREVQDIIKKSREHTARLLKSLYDKNFLIRENKGKYFVYSITDIGNRFIVQ
jgi:hypothetical protein